MKVRIFLTICFCAALTGPAIAAQSTSPALSAATGSQPGQTLNQSDRAFLRRANATNLAEIKLGKLAASESTNSAAKAFANQMITDHTAADQKLQAIARDQSLVLEASTSAAQKETYETLKGLLGDTFDHAYARAAIENQRAAIRLFTAEEQVGVDPALRAYAAQMLPTLRAHLFLAMKLPQG